jgi:hypothetical protein
MPGVAFSVGLGSKFLILLHHLLFPVDPVGSSESYEAESHPVCNAAAHSVQETP